VTDVLVNGVSQGTTATEFTIGSVNGDTFVTATFDSDEFTVTSTVTGAGSIEPSGTQTVPYGMNKTFSFTPDAGQVIKDVKVDGRSVGAVSSYTLPAVQANHTIQVQFAAP